MPDPSHMPQRRQEQPLAPPPNRGTLSGVEYAFGFSDEHFNAYMMQTTTQSVTNGRLLGLAEAMTENPRALVRLAAGWALAEAAILRPQSRNPDAMEASYTRRIEYLERAQDIWVDVDRGLAAEQERALERRNDELASEYFAFRLRTMAARAAVPVMHTVVEWRSGRETPQETLEERVQMTRGQVLSMAGELRKTWDDGEWAFVRKTRGVAMEHLTQLILQAYRPEGEPKYLILPASLRQDHNDIPALRSDLLAVDCEGRHSKKLIQVTREPRRTSATPQKGAFNVHIHEDLPLDPHHKASDTLDAVLGQKRGRSVRISASTQDRLAAMSDTLGSRLTLHEPGGVRRKRRQSNGE